MNFSIGIICLLVGSAVAASVPDQTVDAVDTNFSAGIEKRARACGAAPSELTQKYKAAVLQKHNYYREGENAALGKLSWSEDLAGVAQEWANKCNFDHQMMNDCDNNYAGQNLYATASWEDGFPEEKAVEGVINWWREKPDYDFKSKTCNRGKICGHYTQVVWKDTTEVGCGIAKCGTKLFPGFSYSWIMVCNYSPGGNYQGKNPY